LRFTSINYLKAREDPRAECDDVWGIAEERGDVSVGIGSN
jgi:hypothetical protein